MKTYKAFAAVDEKGKIGAWKCLMIKESARAFEIIKEMEEV